MKRITILGAALLLIAALSCEKTPAETAASITPTGSTADAVSKGITVGAAAVSTSLTFTTTREWSVSSEETKALVSWLSITPASGKAGENTVTVTVLANTGLEPRKAKITVTSVDKSMNITLTQSAREMQHITSVTIDKTEVSLYAGQTETLTATVLPTNADEDKTVTWTSSNDKVASVSGGVVTAVAEGEATITAAAGGKSASCKVTVLHTADGKGSHGEDLDEPVNANPWN